LATSFILFRLGKKRNWIFSFIAKSTEIVKIFDGKTGGEGKRGGGFSRREPPAH